MLRSRGWHVLSLALSLLMLWLLALAIEIVTYSSVHDDGPVDAAIVLNTHTDFALPQSVKPARFSVE